MTSPPLLLFRKFIQFGSVTRPLARGLCPFCFTFNVSFNGTITETWYYWLRGYVLYIVLCLYCMLYMLLSHHLGLRAFFLSTTALHNGFVFCCLVLHATCYNQITLAWGMRSVLPLLSELTLARLLITFSPGKDHDDGDKMGMMVIMSWSKEMLKIPGYL